MMLNPYENDWTQESDSEVAWAASEGIPPAVDEAKRRGFYESASLVDRPSTEPPTHGMG